MIAMFSARQAKELRTRGVTDDAVESLDTTLFEMKGHLASSPQARRDRIQRLTIVATSLANAADALDKADNFSLGRIQAHAMGNYPKTAVSANELRIAILSFSRGAHAAAVEFEGKGPKRGPDPAFSTHVARTVLTILCAHTIPAMTLDNKILETTIAIAFEILGVTEGAPAKYAKKVVGHVSKPRKV